MELNTLIENWKKGLYKTSDNIPACSKNERGENVLVYINKNTLVIKTLQHNSWVRVNAFYKDGTTTETYE